MIVRLDNPPRNFMTTRMVGELDEVMRGLEGDRSVGSVVITGALDDVFITHFDVAEIVQGSEGIGLTISPTQAGGSLRALGRCRASSRARADCWSAARPPASSRCARYTSSSCA